MLQRITWEVSRLVKGRFSRINRHPVFILGNQKSGTTAIASLLAIATGQSVQNDIFCWQGNLPFEFAGGKISFREYLHKSKEYYSSQLIKEPSLSFFYDALKQEFSPTYTFFIFRDPFDNIRSILNRLHIDGQVTSLSKEEYQRVNSINPDWYHIIEGDLYGHRGNNHVETLALRYNKMVEEYLRNKEWFILLKYEDFVKDKSAFITDLATKIGVVNQKSIEAQKDFQFQPKGEKIRSIDFFSNRNYHVIDEITRESRKQIGYS